MDLAAGREAGLAAPNALKHVRDEVAEKCQKLFQEFLEEFQGSDGEVKYLRDAEELIRPERNTLIVSFADLEQFNQQLATTVQEEFYRVYPFLCRAVKTFVRDHGTVPPNKDFYVAFHDLATRHNLVIRGDREEHAVLCSKDKTYDMKIADTSNTLLFLPGCETPEDFSSDKPTSNILHTQISGISKNFWELRKCRPKLKKLKKLLMENPYGGPDGEKESASANSKYTTEDLLDQVQASEGEIMNQLKVLKACQIEGHWRMLDFDYEMKLLNHVTQLIYSESWPFSKVPLSVCLQELGSLEPAEMIEHILLHYGRKYIDEGETYFEMNEDKICQAIAQMLLQNAVRFSLSEFQEVWQQSVPEGMTTRQDLLKGLALVDQTSRPETIFLLNVEDLPEDSQERFNSLFSIREKWTEADITPYIQDLCTEKQTVGALLTKYARSSMLNGLRVYNSRRPIS